jgi:hypothetical protein
MAYSIEDFKAQVAKERGLSSPNLFMITLPSLQGAKKPNGDRISGYSTQEFNILCRAANIPGRQILTMDRQIGAVNTQVAYGFAVPDVVLSFYLTNTFKLKSYFEDWQQLAMSNEAPYEPGYYNDYVRNIKIHQIRKGESIPIYNKALDFNINEKLGGAGQIISNHLPTVNIPGTNGLDLGRLIQGDLSIALVSASNFVYEVNLEDAYPTSMTDVPLQNDLDGISELTIAFRYKNWTGQTPEQKKTYADRVEDFVSGAINAATGFIEKTTGLNIFT